MAAAGLGLGEGRRSRPGAPPRPRVSRSTRRASGSMRRPAPRKTTIRPVDLGECWPVAAATKAVCSGAVTAALHKIAVESRSPSGFRRAWPDGGGRAPAKAGRGARVNRLDRYILRQLVAAFGFFVLVFTGVVWLTQAVRLIDTVDRQRPERAGVPGVLGAGAAAGLRDRAAARRASARRSTRSTSSTPRAS